MSFVQKLRISRGDLLYLVRGKDAGRPAWHYVLLDRLKLGEFKAKLKTGSLDVSDYGKVIRSGWGENPPQDVVDAMTREYT